VIFSITEDLFYEMVLIAVVGLCMFGVAFATYLWWEGKK